MTEDQIDRRDYGRLEAQVEQLAKEVAALHDTMEDVKSMMQQAKGGWKLLLAVGGAAAAVASLFAWVLQHMIIK